MVSVSVRMVKVSPLLDILLTVTTTGPVVASPGTGTVMFVSFQLLGIAGVPLKVTVLVPWLAPKLEPVIVTKVFIGPDDGERLEIIGGIVNVTPLLEIPLTVTITGPVLAPVGTGAIMVVSLQVVGVARAPLKVTVLFP